MCNHYFFPYFNKTLFIFLGYENTGIQLDEIQMKETEYQSNETDTTVVTDNEYGSIPKSSSILKQPHRLDN